MILILDDCIFKSYVTVAKTTEVKYRDVLCNGSTIVQVLQDMELSTATEAVVILVVMMVVMVVVVSIIMILCVHCIAMMDSVGRVVLL